MLSVCLWEPHITTLDVGNHFQKNYVRPSEYNVFKRDTLSKFPNETFQKGPWHQSFLPKAHKLGMKLWIWIYHKTMNKKWWFFPSAVHIFFSQVVYFLSHRLCQTQLGSWILITGCDVRPHRFAERRALKGECHSVNKVYRTHLHIHSVRPAAKTTGWPRILCKLKIIISRAKLQFVFLPTE